MKKTLIVGGVAVALAGAVVGGAAYTGKRTQTSMQAGIAQLQTLWPSVKVVEDHYDRSLFSATHTVTLSLGCPAKAADQSSAARASAPESFVLTLKERIQHGPLPGFSTIGAALIDTELVGVPASEAIAWGSDKQSPLTGRTLIGLLGGYSSHIAVAPGQVTGPDGARMEWKAITADLKASSTDVSGPWSYKIALPAVEVQVIDDKMAMQMHIGAFEASGDVDAGGSMWLRTGKSQGAITSMEMTVQPQARAAAAAGGQALPTVAVKLAKLAYTSEATRDKADLISTSTSVRGEGQVADTKLDKFEMQASIKRLHAPSYAALIEHLMSSPCDEADMAAAARLAKMQKDALQLLPYNPEYSLDKLAVEIDGKRGQISYAFGIDGVTAADTQMPLAMLMTKVKASGKAQVPREWVTKALGSAGERFGGKGGDAASRAEMMNMMLDQATTSGFVLREGEMLSSNFELTKGRMLVNGKPIGAPPPPAN